MTNHEFFAQEIQPWMGRTSDFERNVREKLAIRYLTDMVNQTLPPRERIREEQVVAIRYAISEIGEKETLQEMYMPLIQIATYINSWK